MSPWAKQSMLQAWSSDGSNQSPFQTVYQPHDPEHTDPCYLFVYLSHEVCLFISLF